MACGLSYEELYIIWKLAYKSRWYPKHQNPEDAISGVPSDKVGDYREALESLKKKGLVGRKPAQGREDVYLHKSKREEYLEMLRAHEDEHDRIKYLEFIK